MQKKSDFDFKSSHRHEQCIIFMSTRDPQMTAWYHPGKYLSLHLGAIWIELQWTFAQNKIKGVHVIGWDLFRSFEIEIITCEGWTEILRWISMKSCVDIPVGINKTKQRHRCKCDEKYFKQFKGEYKKVIAFHFVRKLGSSQLHF